MGPTESEDIEGHHQLVRAPAPLSHETRWRAPPDNDNDVAASARAWPIWLQHMCKLQTPSREMTGIRAGKSQAAKLWHHCASCISGQARAGSGKAEDATVAAYPDYCGAGPERHMLQTGVVTTLNREKPWRALRLPK